MAEAASRYAAPDLVDAAISAYLSEQQNVRIVSAAAAVRRLRARMPACEVPDEELACRIALSAIRRGFGVEFEGRQEEPNSVPFRPDDG